MLKLENKGIYHLLPPEMYYKKKKHILVVLRVLRKIIHRSFIFVLFNFDSCDAINYLKLTYVTVCCIYQIKDFYYMHWVIKGNYNIINK